MINKKNRNNKNLSEGSKRYYHEANIYEHFSEVEDKPKLILNFLKEKIKSKIVLDLGCGTGKFLKPLSPISKEYIGLDISANQIEIAKTKTANFDNVKFLCSSAESINLLDKSVDVIISTWVLGTILEEERRLKALNEAKRVLKENGEIFLVENNIGGEFETIRGRYPNLEETKKYNDWLESQGFKPINKFETYFEFDSEKEAKENFKAIWGKETSKQIRSKRIKHKIIIYYLKKQ